MAGDWIKVEMDTPDKPEIGFIARACGVTPPVAFEAWFRLWCWFDRQTENGEVQFFTPEDADRIARLPGIGDALSTDQGCGWVTFHARGATIVNWDSHNGCSAKKRALTNKRVSRWREAEKRGPLAQALGQAEKSGDQDAIEKAKAEHDAYRDLCLKADKMNLGIPNGAL